MDRLPPAVARRFSHDSAGRLAALIAYYTFFALFPLLLVAVTIFGFILRSHPALRVHLLTSALSGFPLLGDTIRENVHAASGNAGALIIGLVGALFAGLGGIGALQDAMNEIWDVPKDHRPKLLPRLARDVLMLLLFGGFIILSSVLPALAGSSGSGLPMVIAVFMASVLLNFGLFLAAFKVLTVKDLSWRDVLAGAATAAIAWSLLQHAGSYIMQHRLQSAGRVYGSFAFVIGLLSWLYLGAQVTLACAEINVVRVRKLYKHRPSSVPAPWSTDGFQASTSREREAQGDDHDRAFQERARHDRSRK